MAVTTTPIDPANSLRGAVITPGTVDANVNPAQAATPTPVTSGTIQTSAIDPASAAKASAMTASGGANLAHNINAQSVMRNAMNAFQSQLPQMNIDFADQSDALAKKTAAMGRTGSGLFNRDTGYISDRARAAREGLLGNLSFNAATTDAANSLQAQIQQQQLREAQQGRFANTNIANMQSGNQLAGMNAQMANNLLMQNNQYTNQAAMQDASNALQAQLANQSMGGQVGMFNAGQANDVNLQNALNMMNQNQFNANFAAGQQGYQNQLANQAQNDLYNQMMMFQQGFNNNPINAMIASAGGIGGIGQEYGANAGQAGTQAGQGAQSLIQMLLGGMGGGGQQALPQGIDPMAVAANPQGYQQWQQAANLFNQGPQPIGLQPAQPQGLASFMQGTPNIVPPQMDY